MSARRTTTRPANLRRAIVLALPPTLTVLAITGLVQLGGGSHLVFAPLAASAFLIYHAPRERANGVGVVVASQLVGAACGFGVATLGHPGYASEAAALLATITILVGCDLLHAPAIPTSLAFADAPAARDHALWFVAAVVLLAALSAGQRALQRAVYRRPERMP